MGQSSQSMAALSPLEVFLIFIAVGRVPSRAASREFLAGLQCNKLTLKYLHMKHAADVAM